MAAETERAKTPPTANPTLPAISTSPRRETLFYHLRIFARWEDRQPPEGCLKTCRAVKPRGRVIEFKHDHLNAIGALTGRPRETRIDEPASDTTSPVNRSDSQHVDFRKLPGMPD